MDRRFGLKDFFLFALVLGLGVLVLFSMVQEDRKWTQITALKDQVKAVEQLAGRVARTLDERGVGGGGISGDQMAQVLARLQMLQGRLDQIQESGVRVADGGKPAPGGSATPAGASAAGGDRDESWARPGVPIQWQPAYAFRTDPRSVKGFKEGGSFTEIFDARPAKVTPYIQTDVYGRRAVDLVMETLGTYDPVSLKLRGQLADAWQLDPSGLWVRARIRAQARYSDGTPVVAEDFRYAFHDIIMNPQIEAQRTRSTVADQVDRVEVISDRVVEFHFKQVLFSNLSTALTIYPLPKHIYTKYTPAQINSMPGLMVGTGPYKMRSLDWTPDVPLVLVRNEQYWGPKPAIDEMRFITYNDETPRLVAYRNGEGDMTTPSSPQFVTLSEDKKFTGENQLLNWLNMKSGRAGLIWNCGPRGGKPTPFVDARVRRAMTLLLDREKMIRDIWKGIGAVPNGFLNPESVGYDESLKPWPYDRRAGMALLKEAGWEDRDKDGVLENEKGEPFQFELTTFGGGEISERIVLFVQDAYGAAGIKVVPRSMDWSVGDQVRKQRDFDCMMMGWGANAPESDPKQIFHSDSIKDQGDNFAQYASPEMDKAIDDLRRELDDDKRALIWHRFSRVMHDDQPYTWVRVAPFLRFVKGDVGNVQTYAKGLEPWEFFRGGAMSPTPGN